MSLFLFELGYLGEGRSSFENCLAALTLSVSRSFHLDIILSNGLFFQQALQHTRHTYDKVLYKKSTIQQMIEEHEQLIDQLSIISEEWNEKVR